jgi:hypothetical protein
MDNAFSNRARSTANVNMDVETFNVSQKYPPNFPHIYKDNGPKATLLHPGPLYCSRSV